MDPKREDDQRSKRQVLDQPGRSQKKPRLRHGPVRDNTNPQKRISMRV